MSFTNGNQHHAASQVQHFPDAAASLWVSGTALTLPHSFNGHAILDCRRKDESTGQSILLCIRAYSGVAVQPSTAGLQRQTKSPIQRVIVVSTLLNGFHWNCVTFFFSEFSETCCRHICSKYTVMVLLLLLLLLLGGVFDTLKWKYWILLFSPAYLST